MSLKFNGVHRVQISLIEEYHTRLISDVVTGKLDVRGVQVEEVLEDMGIDALDGASDEADGLEKGLSEGDEEDLDG